MKYVALAKPRKTHPENNRASFVQRPAALPDAPHQSLLATGAAAGILGSFAITLLGLIGIDMQWSSLSLELFLGSMLTGATGPGAWLLGFLWHASNGALFGLIYACVFQFLGRATGAMGIVLSMAHWFGAGVLINYAMGIHPLAAGATVMRMPVSTISFGGMTFFGSLLSHLAFGAVVGKACGRQMSAAKARAGKTGEQESQEFRKSA